MRRALPISLVLLGLAVPPAGAQTFKRCLDGVLVEARCARVTVPLDHSGRTPGTIRLLVTRVGPPRRSGKALVYLSGGPGGAGIEEFELAGAPVHGLRSYDLIAFDQRGTGSSALLNCPGLQKDRRLRSTRLAEQCAERIGPRRRFFTTAATVQDLEAVRKAAGARKLLLFGVSYGTKVALAYSRAYPERVERMILDSVVDPDEADPWGLDSFAAMGATLKRLCPRRCRGITDDPVADLAELSRRLVAKPLRGVAHDPMGRGHKRTLTATSVADLIFDGDYAPSFRAAVPAAVRAALRADDPVPLLRLMELVRPLSDPAPARSFSAGRYAAVCEETPLPWERTVADPQERLRQGLERAGALPPGAFDPFGFDAIRADEFDLCLRWPRAAEAPVLPRAGGPYPEVPVLILQGMEDLRTPPSVSARIASRFPRAKRVTVQGLGHAPIGSDPTGCLTDRLRAWLRGRRVASRCGRVRTGMPAVGVPPSVFEDLQAVRGLKGRVGRTVAAIDATFDDMLLSLSLSIFHGDRGSGLRGGVYVFREQGLMLRRLRIVPGVLISGRPARGGLRLSITGSKAARGTVFFSDDGHLSGRLGGRRVSLRLPGGGPPRAFAARRSSAPFEAVSARSRLVR